MFCKSLKRLKNRKGATLLELSIVVAIIGILTIFAMRYYSQEKDSVRLKATKSKVKQLKDAIISYYAENNRFPHQIADLKPKYIKETPVKNGWGLEFSLVEDEDIPKLKYRILLGGRDTEVIENVVSPWNVDTFKNYTLKNIFDLKNDTSKIMVGKNNVYSYKDDEEVVGQDEYGRDIPNDMYGEYVFGASMEIWILAPDDPDTTEKDPGHDFKFSITSGEIVDVTCDDPKADIEDDGTGFQAKSNLQLVHYKLGVVDCSYTTEFTLEVFKPRIPNTKIYYGQHEILSVPETELDSYVEGTKTIYFRPQIPVIISRPLHENTKALN